MELNKEDIEEYKELIGMFCVVEYNIGDNIICAKGILDSVSNEGFLKIRHTRSKTKFWRFHLSKVVSEYFERCKK